MQSYDSLKVKVNMQIDEVLKKFPYYSLAELLSSLHHQFKKCNITSVAELKKYIEREVIPSHTGVDKIKIVKGRDEEEVIERDGELANIKTLEDVLVYLKNNPMGVKKNELYFHYKNKICKATNWYQWYKIYKDQLVRVSIYKGYIWLSSTEDERLAGMMEPSMTPRDKSIKDEFIKICEREMSGNKLKENKKTGKGQQQAGSTGQSYNSHIKGFDYMKKEYLEELRKKN